jgi:hypothetical protein
MDQPNLYSDDDIVWFTEQSCHAKVMKVRRPIGDGDFRYDIECDDGEVVEYVEEYRLYPSTLPPIPEAA